MIKGLQRAAFSIHEQLVPPIECSTPERGDRTCLLPGIKQAFLFPWLLLRDANLRSFEHLTIYCGIALDADSFGAAGLICEHEGSTVLKFGQVLGAATCNEAQYMAVLYGGMLANVYCCKNASIKTNSQLILTQSSAASAVRNRRIADYATHLWELLNAETKHMATKLTLSYDACLEARTCATTALTKKGSLLLGLLTSS